MEHVPKCHIGKQHFPLREHTALNENKFQSIYFIFKVTLQATKQIQ